MPLVTTPKFSSRVAAAVQNTKESSLLNLRWMGSWQLTGSRYRCCLGTTTASGQTPAKSGNTSFAETMLYQTLYNCHSKLGPTAAVLQKTMQLDGKTPHSLGFIKNTRLALEFQYVFGFNCPLSIPIALCFSEWLPTVRLVSLSASLCCFFHFQGFIFIWLIL